MTSAKSGTLQAQGLKIAVVCSRFGELASDRLLDGALDMLRRLGAETKAIDVVRVPGAFELPLATRRLIDKGYDAVVALGVVVKGETPHFDFICSTVAAALNRLSVENKTALGFGLVTTNNMEQALDRAGGKAGNRGADAAAAAVEMATLLRSLG